MKKIVSVFVVTLALFSISAQNALEHGSIADESSVTQQFYHGIVKRSADAWVIQVRSEGESIDYLPSNLMDEFKVEGLEVIFSGELVNVPANIRIIGKPIRLTNIKKV